MSLRINNNIAAINGHRNLLNNSHAIGRSLQKLSSGLRINTAADDAAGLVISEQMRAQITGIDQAVANTETAVAMVQTAEGALDELNALLNKARALTLHAANRGTNDVNQLVADQAELDNVIESINRISEFTQFGTKKLLDGTLNGTSDLESGLERVRVGNLTSNPAIEFGQVRVLVNGSLAESNILRGGGVDTDAYVFSSVVTGMALGSAVARAGVDVTMVINGKTYGYRTSSDESAATVAATLTAITEPDGYQVSFDNSNNGFRITDVENGDNDFTASLTFDRDAIQDTPGQTYQFSSRISATAGTPTANIDAADAIFSGVAGLSGVNASTEVEGGVRFTLTVDSDDGYSASFVRTGQNGENLGDILNNLQSDLQSGANGFSGGLLSYTTSTAAAFNVLLDRGEDAITDAFTFTLEVDHPNVQNGSTQVAGRRLDGLSINTGATATDATFIDNAGTAGVTGSNLQGASRLNPGNNIKFVVDEHVLIVSGLTPGPTMDDVATKAQQMLVAIDSKYANYQIVFASGGENVTGLGAGGAFADAGSVQGQPSFFISAGADSNEQFTFDLQVDQSVGFDVNATAQTGAAGAASNATLNLDSISGTTIQTGRPEVSGHAAVVISNAAGSTINVNGRDATASMVTADGTTLNLTQESVSSTGGTHIVLDPSASSNQGFEGIEVDLDSDLATNGGSRTFNLSQGAAFQVGPNDAQQVFVTIESTHSDELGRGASDSLASVAELSSLSKSALLNELTDDALAVIDTAIDQVTTIRGRLGAFQANTLESGLSSLRVSNENLTSAESTIRDVDFAAESAEFTKNNILVQSATAMLAQANQLPQNVLQLLQ